MSENLLDSGVWFVYDGACPLCSYAANAVAIKERYGELHLLDARESHGHILMDKINALGLDLDEGMVIYCRGRLYHGAGALQFMAKFGAREGGHNLINNLINRALFPSERVAAIIYPWLRGVRNSLLRRLGKPKIDNLNLKSRPIFQDIFGEDWDRLPSVIKKHYSNRPYSDQRITVAGALDIRCRSYLRLLRPFYRILGSVPAVNENNVAVTVNFDSAPDTKAFHFNRIFHFSNRPMYRFRSHMVQVNANEVIEIMRFGFCWRMIYGWDGDKVTLRHNGYALKIFAHYLPLPITALLGRGDANEVAVDDDHFEMEVTITHPYFGIVYSYQGRFKVIEACD